MITLGALAEELGGELVGDGGLRLHGAHHDSRRVGPGDVFVATVGARHDGHSFVVAARGRGATASVVERREVLQEGAGVVVPDGRRALARVAQCVYGDPTSDLCTVGITGTNGKTTVLETLAHVLGGSGARVARMGTLGMRFEGLAFDQGLNTPEADDVMRIAARLRQEGATHWLFEATSHGLAQHRLDGVRLDLAAFTNLTRDHLDLHDGMAAYFAAKRRLFTDLCPRRAVVVVDGPHGRTLADELSAEVLRVSTDPRARADVRPTTPLRPGPDGWSFDAVTPHGEVMVRSARLGRHEAANLLLVLAMAEALGLPAPEVAAALASAPPVPGRLQRFEDGGRCVLVDYAHSPDALEHALEAARLLTRRRLVCVFGCGGDRDAGKRPVMGAIAARLADHVVVTTDNPRGEDPAQVAEAVAEGAPGCEIILDRRAAIEAVVAELGPGDVALVAGRGHETMQVTATGMVALDDRAVVRAALTTRSP